jgi:hypothetical protein
MKRSLPFYEKTLGLKVLFRAGDGLVFLDGGQVGIGLNAGLAEVRQPVAGAVELVFAVGSVKAAPGARGPRRHLRDRAAAGHREGMGRDLCRS